MELETERTKQALEHLVRSRRLRLGRGRAVGRGWGPAQVVHVRHDAEALLPEILDDGAHDLGLCEAGRCQAEGHGDRLEEAADAAEGQVLEVLLTDGEVMVGVLYVSGKQGVVRSQRLGELGQRLALAGSGLGEAFHVLVVVYHPRLVGRVRDVRR